MTFILDIGGEGRHRDAWNLNTSPIKTINPGRGEPIPRLILGRADRIPLADQSVDRVIVERTPLRVNALHEIARVIAPGGVIILRHAVPPRIDPHRLAREILPGRATSRMANVLGRQLMETRFELGRT